MAAQQSPCSKAGFMRWLVVMVMFCRREHVFHAFPRPAQAGCGTSQGSLESGESIKLWTSSTPQKGCVVPLLEPLLKYWRAVTGIHSYYDWGTLFPLIKAAFPLMCNLVSGLSGRKCHFVLLWGPSCTTFKM